MTTKSIFKTIEIKDRRSCRRFVKALESAEKKKSIHIEISKPVIEVKGIAIKDLFEDRIRKNT